MNNQYRILRYYPGKYGYPEKYEYCELQQYNHIYNDWYNVCYGKLDIQFIKNECLFRKLDFNLIPQYYVEKSGKLADVKEKK